MMRETSIEAAGLLEELGVTARRQRQVFETILNARSPLTRSEVAFAMKVPVHYICAAVLALVRARILIEPRMRFCRMTGFKAWELALNPWGRQLKLDLGEADALGPTP